MVALLLMIGSLVFAALSYLQDRGRHVVTDWATGSGLTSSPTVNNWNRVESFDRVVDADGCPATRVSWQLQSADVALTLSSPATIEGLTGDASDRRVVYFGNQSTLDVCLVDEDVSVAADARFELPGQKTFHLRPRQYAYLYYDGVINRWRVIGTQIP